MMMTLPHFMIQSSHLDLDETAVLLRCLPTKSYKAKGQKCASGKLSKERVSRLFFCNSYNSIIINFINNY